MHLEASQTFNSRMYPTFLVATIEGLLPQTIQNSGVDFFPRKNMGVNWSLYKISNCETRKSRKWCRWEDASNFSSCPGLKRRNRVVSVYVAPSCQASCQPPPKPSSSRRGRRLQRRRWRAACGRSEDGHDEVCEMGRGWFLGEDGTPCPSLPCPDHCPTLPGLGPIRK